MKTKHLLAFILLLFALSFPLSAFSQGTAITYQGRLLENGQPGNGSYDLAFTVFKASTGGSAEGTLTNAGVAVSGGLFTTTLDFGGVPDGSRIWFQLGVRTNGGGNFTTVSPRQEATPTLYALFANTASNLVGSLPVAQLSGILPLAQLPAEVVVSSGPSGVNLTGTFAGNGGGLTNVAAANLVGAIADARLSANIPRLNVLNTAATATAVPIVTSGFITSANVTSGGSGYLTPPLVTVNAAMGGGADLRAVIAGGSVTSFTVTNAGSGYFGSVTLTIAPPPSNASQTFITPNIFSGVNTMTNAANTFAGSFAGNGAGLTNLPASVVAAAPPGMVLIPAGAFTMGDPLDGYAIPTNVAVSAFYLDVNLVSWSQWQSVYYWATNHGYQFFTNTYIGVYQAGGKAANHPVQAVGWWDCVKWCNARSQQAGKPPVYYTDAGLTAVYTNGEPATLYPHWAASGYRLPTEAEWEKAARGGLSGQRFPWGNVINQNLANYNGNTGSYSYDLGPDGFNAAFTNGGYPYTSPVGSFAANGYGLNDMAGNVWQWCWDWYDPTYAGGSDPRGPAGPLSYRVLRGGAWNYVAIGSQCAYRNYVNVPNYADLYIGFRCVRGF